MTNNGRLPVSTWLRYLPAVLREGAFINAFLLGFEATLSGRVPPPEEGAPSPMPEGLDVLLDAISTYFDPDETPADFLPWLAQWVATSLRDDWSESTRRAFIASIVPLYSQRGTLPGIKNALQLCLPENDGVELVEPDEPPHYFEVHLSVPSRESDVLLQSTIRKVESIVDQQKPAHTFYRLFLYYPSLQVFDEPDPKDLEKGIYVGRNTILGSVPLTSKS